MLEDKIRYKERAETILSKTDSVFETKPPFSAASPRKE